MPQTKTLKRFDPGLLAGFTMSDKGSGQGTLAKHWCHALNALALASAVCVPWAQGSFSTSGGQPQQDSGKMTWRVEKKGTLCK